MRRALHTLTWLLAGVVLMGCGSDDGETGATQPAADTSAVEDTGAVISDEGPAPDTDEPDTSPTPDPGAEPDEGPVPVNPLAMVWPANPVATPDLVEVALQHITHPEWALSGDFANSLGCVRDLEGGEKIPFDLGGFVIDMTMCTPDHTAFPGEDGTYRHILPPENHGAGDDAFAEVMMYHHIQIIHDYYQTVHSLEAMDFTLDAITNLQVFVDAPPFCEDWATLPNAAYLPPGSLGELGVPVPLDPDKPYIIFSGSETQDFSYDADVIYHEYSHAMVGPNRLGGTFMDLQGLNNLPVAINEAYADYYAATVADDSVMGDYALTSTEPLTICGIPLSEAGASSERDLSKLWTCPAALTAEVHADSQIYSSAMWAVRGEIGAEKADALFMEALETFTHATGFEIGAAATIAIAKQSLSPAEAAAVEAAFVDRGLVGCQRVLSLAAIGSRGVPLNFEGASSQSPFDGQKMPGYVQLSAQVPEGATELVIQVKAGGGGMFGGSGTFEFEAAWKPGEAAIVLDIEKGTHDGVLETPFEKVEEESGVYQARISGDCLTAGPWTLAIFNKGGAVAFMSASSSFSTDPAQDPNLECPE